MPILSNHVSSGADDPGRARLMRYATYASSGTAVIIIIAKIAGWLMTGSVALLASLADSVLDVIVSVITMIAVHYALQPPDEEHRFGHGKAEDLAIFTQSAFIVASALLIAVQACKRFSVPVLPSQPLVGISVSLFATLMTLMLVCFQRHVIRKTGSGVIIADSIHYISDIMINISIILSLTINIFAKTTWIDPLLALCIAIYMIYSAWGIVQEAFNNLMDHEFKPDDKEIIIELINRHPQIIGMHEMKTRRSGNKCFIQFHLEMDGNITLFAAHHISDEIEQAIRKKFPSAEIFIHQDPRKKH